MRVLFVLMALSSALFIAPVVINAQSSSTFVADECTVDVPTDREVECGTIRVPLDHNNPDIGSAVLPIVIARSSTPTNNTPLYLLQGGPGGDTVETFAYLLTKPNSLLPNDRDVVFYEQRGTTNAIPALDCPEVHELGISLLNQDISYAEGVDKYITGYEQCVTRLRKSGVDFSLFNSEQNARDTIDIANQLGHTQINLYGVSYGSVLAQHITRINPDLIRTLVIDGIVAPDANVDARIYESRHNALNAVFSDCENNSDCARAYPQLRQTYATVMADYRDNPRTWQLSDPTDASITRSAIVDNYVLQGWVFSWLYDDQIVQLIPLMIDQLANNQTDQVRLFASFIVFNDGIAEMMYMSTQCSEDVTTQSIDYVIPNGNLMPLMDGEIENDSRYREALCAMSQVTPLSAEFNEAFRTNVPTLIVSGRYDPITPAIFGDIVASTNPHATHIVISNGAHGAMLSNACAATIAKSLWDDPTTPLDTSCVATQQSYFVNPNDLILTDFATQTAQLHTNVYPSLIIIGTAFMTFLFVLLIRILRTLVQIVRRQAPQPAVIRAQKFMQTLVSIGGMAVIGYLLVQLAILITNYDYSLFFGISDPDMTIRWAIWGFMGLTLLNVFSAIRALTHGSMRWQSVVVAGIIVLSSVGLSIAFITNQLY
jgi:pimeloyl-ACP methyl ester carboxylesterase